MMKLGSWLIFVALTSVSIRLVSCSPTELVTSMPTNRQLCEPAAKVMAGSFVVFVVIVAIFATVPADGGGQIVAGVVPAPQPALIRVPVEGRDDRALDTT